MRDIVFHPLRDVGIQNGSIQDGSTQNGSTQNGSIQDVCIPERMNCPYYYHPHPLAAEAAAIVQSEISLYKEWMEEVSKGKMFGVLVVVNSDGVVGYLQAFSGQLHGTFTHEGWVPPVYDFLAPDGFFRQEERCISEINAKVTSLSNDKVAAQARRDLHEQEELSRNAVEEMRRVVAERKHARELLRAESGYSTPEMIRESQFLKAELKRLIRAESERLQPLRDIVSGHDRKIRLLREERKHRSELLQQKLFDHFVVVNGNGDNATLSELFRDTPQRVPPSGSGECCAPKLLNYALSHGMRPVALAEFWWGESPQGLIRRHLSYYPACSGKCKPILDFMLQGVNVEPNPLLLSQTSADVEIVYEDEWCMIVDKPSGMLSAKGRGEAQCVIDTLQEGRGDSTELYNVNRLDMQTSGLLVLAKLPYAQSALRRLFEERKVEKVYEAVLDGEYRGPSEGVITLPLAPDYIHRPCQKVDKEKGKEAITHYYILRVREGYTYVLLHPITGRTHQLRVHCAHHEGLAIPIVGDSLYGTASGKMMLRCVKMSFQHPFTGETLKLEVPSFDCM